MSQSTFLEKGKKVKKEKYLIALKMGHLHLFFISWKILNFHLKKYAIVCKIKNNTNNNKEEKNKERNRERERERERKRCFIVSLLVAICEWWI